MTVFAEAYSTVNSVEGLVLARIEDARNTAETLQTTALSTIESLRNVVLGGYGDAPPTAPNGEIRVTADFNLPDVAPTAFGSITADIPDMPTLGEVDVFGAVEIPEFNASINSFNLPTRPEFGDVGEPPERPTLGEVDIPADPAIDVPTPPVLELIDIPTFDGLTLPTFDATEPTFAGSALPPGFQWSEPDYLPEILDEMMDKVRNLWSGGSGLPAAIENAIYERAADREDRAAAQAIDSVAEDFSSRGFTQVSGLQAARVDRMIEEVHLKKVSANRDYQIEAAKWHIENIRFAIQQAVAAENVLVNIFLNSTERVFQAARFQIEALQANYNLQVTLYNAAVAAYKTKADVFDVQVRAALAEIEVYKAEVEAAIAAGRINQQRVEAYRALVEAVNSRVEIFATQMRGAAIQAEIKRSEIEGYRAEVEAYAARVGADRTRFDAYEAAVRGELAKAGIINAEAQGYSALVQGKVAAVDIEVKRVDAAIARNSQLIDVFRAQISAEETRMQAELSTIQAGAQAYIANTQRFGAEATAEAAKAQVEVSAEEATARSAIALYQANSSLYLGRMEQVIRQASIAVDALKAAGQLSTTLAAGAYAGVNVNAALSGSGQVSASGSGSTQQSTSTGTSTNYNHNYEGV